MKKLIIVVDDKTMAYGELLSALISMEDDKRDENGNLIEGGIIGIEDGSVEAAVWTDKVYMDNQAQLSSNTKVVFIGKSEPANAIIANINASNEFSQFGVYFGSLGNKAAIYTDKKQLSSNQNNYDNFIDAYNSFIVNSEVDFLSSQVREKNDIPAEIAKAKAAGATEKVGKAVGFGLKGLTQGIKNAPEIATQVSNDYKSGGLLDKVTRKASEITTSAVESAITIKDSTTDATMEIVKSGKEMSDQQYRCGVIAFFLNQLQNFMEA